MRQETKVERIHEVALFSRADKKTLRELAHVLDEVEIEAGTTIITQGHHHHESFVVESGTFAVLVDGEEVAEIPAGEIIGEIGLLDPGCATATVTSKTAATLLVLPHNSCREVLEATPGLYQHIATELAHRLRSMDAKYHHP